MSTPAPTKIPRPPTRSSFERRRAAVLTQRVRLDNIQLQQALKYGHPLQDHWLSAKERQARTSARKAYDVACGRFHAMLDTCPRQWRQGVPTQWVCEILSYEDATRPHGEPLTTSPPLAYGY